MKKIIKTLVSITCVLMATAVFAGSPKVAKTEQQLIVDQRAAVETLLDASQSKVVIVVDGLCCATCAIGVKKKLQRLDFVAKKGVVLDIENSMTIVTLKEAGTLNRETMISAVRKAGYDPVRFYHYEGGEAKESTISQEG